MSIAHDHRRRFMIQVLAVLAGGGAIAACGKTTGVPTPPTSTETSPLGEPPGSSGAGGGACPESGGSPASWPDGKEPDYMSGLRPVCLPMPTKGGCKTYTESCILSRYACGLTKGGQKVEGTLPSKDGCCWKVQGVCAVGRPFIVDGVALVAPLASGSGWSLPRATLATFETLDTRIAALDARSRAALADVWGRDALTEHASVASFARLVLELLALGAPSELVDGAQRAMGDELRHAQRAFTLASRYAAASLEPGPLDTHRALAERVDLARLAARTAAEGCVAETIAALQLHAAADAAIDPTLAAQLRTTADEESEHALLAFRIVAWAIERGGDDVRASVAAVFEHAASHVGFGPCPDEQADASTLRAHGVLSRRERHDLAVSALEAVVAPAARTLLRGAALAPSLRAG